MKAPAHPYSPEARVLTLRDLAWLSVSLGIVILFSGIGLSPAYPVIGGGFTTIGSVLMAGAPTGAIGTWSSYVTAEAYPAGTPMFDQSTIKFYNLYITDSWHIKPTLTMVGGRVVFRAQEAGRGFKLWALNADLNAGLSAAVPIADAPSEL